MALTPPPSAPPAAPPAPGDAPSRANPSTFRELADAFVVWQVGFRDWLAGMVAWLDGYITWASTNATEMDALQTDVTSKSSAATTAASSATASAAAAQANRTALDNRLYPGTYAADPATRPDGSAVQAGDRYFNSAIARQKTYSGTVWGTDNLDSAALAAPTGGSLVGWIQSGAGALLRNLLAKVRENVSPEDFAAVGDGVANDTAALAAMIASGAKYMRGRGTYKVVALDLTTVPAGGVLDLSAATIRAVPTVANPAIKMGGTAQTIRLGDVVSDTNPTGAAVTDGVALLLESGLYCRYEVGQVLGFRKPVEVRPTQGFGGNNGLSWLTFRSKFLATDTGDCFYARPNDGAGLTGYFTESDIHPGRLDGTRGIVIDANPTMVANAAFRSNGLRIHAPAFENITGDALVMIANNRNTLMQARYENVGGQYINEDANCARNCYDIGCGARSDKISLLGQLYQLNAQLSDATGGVTSLQRWGMSGAGVGGFGLAEAYTLAMNGSLCFRDSFSRYMDDRWQVKRLDGTRRRIRLHSDNEGEFVASGTTAYTVDKASRFVSVATSTSALDLTMPVEKEFNGEFLFLQVRGLTNLLQIKKSSGSVSPKGTSAGGGNITGVGTYLLLYVNDAWSPIFLNAQVPA